MDKLNDLHSQNGWLILAIKIGIWQSGVPVNDQSMTTDPFAQPLEYGRNKRSMTVWLLSYSMLLKVSSFLLMVTLKSINPRMTMANTKLNIAILRLLTPWCKHHNCSTPLHSDRTKLCVFDWLICAPELLLKLPVICRAQLPPRLSVGQARQVGQKYQVVQLC